VIRLAESLQMKVVERHLQPEDMASMKECFLTGTAAEVTPVAKIGDYSFTPSDACRQLVTAYDDLVNGRISL
jgi:branched-chain amino acid aminotransferase